MQASKDDGIINSGLNIFNMRNYKTKNFDQFREYRGPTSYSPFCAILSTFFLDILGIILS